MPYDESLADRIRRAMSARTDVTEKKMFGGVAFLLHGKMFCGIVKDELMVRVGPENFEKALDEPHVRPMNFTGRPMNGYVFVEPEGCLSEKEVGIWAERGAGFVATLKDSVPRRKKQATGITARRTGKK
jgi:TfoX/Sxy family transcriptional regulator of competence genes